MATVDEADAKKFLQTHQDFEIDKLFRALVKLEGSDLHLKVGLAPYVRVNGSLRPLNRDPVDDDEMLRLILPMIKLQERRERIFEDEGGVDFAYTLKVDDKMWRFRVNILQQLGHIGLVARRCEQLHTELRESASAAAIGRTLQIQSGNGSAGRNHRFGKKHHNRLDARLGQPPLSPPHPHARRPD